MAAIILPRRSVKRPSGRLVLVNDFAQAGSFLFDGGHYNPAAFYRNGYGGVGVTPAGTGTLFSETARQSVDFTRADLGFPVQPPKYTTVSVVFSTGTDASYSNIFNFGQEIQVRHTTSNWDFYHRAGTFKLAQWSSGYAQNKIQALVAAYDGTNIQLFGDGALRASTSSTVVNSLSADIVIGRDYSTGTNSYWQGTILATAFIPFYVGQGLATDLAINPWQLFRAEPVRIYSLPAATIPTLSAPGITELGSTSVRPQITLTF